MNLQREVLDSILTEDADVFIVESGLDGDRLLLLETSKTPAS